MAAERANLLQIISDFKAALNRRSDSSDSDEDDLAHGTNRGQKLKRKARYVHEGALNGPIGTKIYEEEIEYGTRKRKVLYRKRKRTDSEDEQMSEGERQSQDHEDDPYGGVQLERILAPAQTPSDIANHPTLAAPYKSQTLNELCRQSLDIICQEHRHTYALKNLLTNFLGDEPFVNLEKMETVHEPDFIRTAREKLERMETQKYEEEQRKKMANEAAGKSGVNGAKNEGDEDVDMKDPSRHASPVASKKEAAETNGEVKEPTTTTTTTKKETGKGKDKDKKDRGGNNANAANRRPATPTPQEILDSTDPLFYPPARDPNVRDWGLNPLEAEETRRLLLLAVQKQEEFVRGLEKVRDGLLRAERMRVKVWDWCRADGQDEPSDGEDWVDLERWGLQAGELKKGVEEEEEDDSKRKTTRGRRN